MKSFNLLLLIAALFILSSRCFAQGRRSNIVVLPLKMQVPAGAKKIGSIAIGNNVTKTNCDYEALINTVKDKAGSMGGNMVKITELIAPVFIGKCYKIKGDVYYVNPLPAYNIQDKTRRDNAGNGPPVYATLYLYRLKDTTAFVGAYDVHLNDSVIYRAKSKSYDSVKIYQGGPLTLLAKIEDQVQLKLDIKQGVAYYIRCGLVKGEIRMVPVLELVNKAEGATEYRNISKAKKDMDVEYLWKVH